MNHSTIRESPSTRILGMILALVILALTLPISSAITEDEEPERIRENVKVNGVKSRNELLEYTIPDELLLADANFAALMMEADKYIGYPFVYGASNPKEGFDCSGFVSWVFIHSGVYNTGRRGATGLHTLCDEVDPEDIRPGDLVFFHGTMGKEVKGITHVGIYVGNHMMIHAGDPVGFADLEDEKWKGWLDCYGRLPFEED